MINQATRDDVLDALDMLEADRQPYPGRRNQDEEQKEADGEKNDGSEGGVDLVSFIRLMRQRPMTATGGPTSMGVQLVTLNHTHYVNNSNVMAT